MSEQFQLFFAPQAWSAVRRFSHFVGQPFEDRGVAKGARVTLSHLDKFEVLAGLANRQAKVNFQTDGFEKWAQRIVAVETTSSTIGPSGPISGHVITT
jgi:hypothetical protein